MYKIVTLIVPFFLLLGCATTGEKVDVTVEGIPHVVKKMKAEGGWMAHEKDLWGGFIDPKSYKLNVLAIEKVTGCKVDPYTISNQGMATTAFVECAER